MKNNYSLETVYQIWNDLNGSRIEVGTDRDSLGLVQIRSISASGHNEREVTLTLEEAAMVHAALGRYLNGVQPVTPQPVKTRVMTESTAMLVALQVKDGKRIDALKTLRRDMDWDLKTAKEWLDSNHPY